MRREETEFEERARRHRVLGEAEAERVRSDLITDMGQSTKHLWMGCAVLSDASEEGREWRMAPRCGPEGKRKGLLQRWGKTAGRAGVLLEKRCVKITKEAESSLDGEAKCSGR